jgi:hypothetical protein
VNGYGDVCLDEAVTGAVTAYGSQKKRDLAYEGHRSQPT